MGKPEGPQAPPIPEVDPDPPAPQALHVPQAAQAVQQPIPHKPPLNWSHFKPECSRKPDKDTKAHLLRTNYWIDTH